jgi:hypothetical protein
VSVIALVDQPAAAQVCNAWRSGSASSGKSGFRTVYISALIGRDEACVLGSRNEMEAPSRLT